MIGRVCCCSSDYCRTNGCQAEAADRAKFGSPHRDCLPDFPDLPKVRPPASKPEPLTEEDIRRIFQEEIRKFRGALYPGVFRNPI